MTTNDKTPKNSLDRPQDYPRLLTEIKERIRSAQYEALKAVNKELVGLYWDIGRMIAERQQKFGWGKAVVENLSTDLRQEFPGVAGFSVQNLWYMRQFYLEYNGHEKLQPLVGEIAWSHNLVIMGKCKDPLEREFYLRMTRKFGWSKNVLIHQIEVLPVFGKKIKFHSLPWLRGASRSGRSSPPYFGNALPARAFTA